jgi:hypothetical protein
MMEKVVISETAVIQPETTQCNDQEIWPTLKLYLFFLYLNDLERGKTTLMWLLIRITQRSLLGMLDLLRMMITVSSVGESWLMYFALMVSILLCVYNRNNNIYYRLTKLCFIKIQTIKMMIEMATCFSPYRAIIRPYRMCVQDKYYKYYVIIQYYAQHHLSPATPTINQCLHIATNRLLQPAISVLFS